LVDFTNFGCAHKIFWKTLLTQDKFNDIVTKSIRNGDKNENYIFNRRLLLRI